MEFQEGMMRYVVHKPKEVNWGFEKDTEKGRIKETPTPTMTPRRKWKLMYLFNRSSSSPPRNPKSKEPPNEFLCPISGSLMAEPVIVTSGHTLEKACVLACKALSFTPTLEEDSSTPDFTSVIPNLALKTAILNWCKTHCLDPPKPIDPINAKNLVRALMEIEVKNPDTQIIISGKNLVQGAIESPTVNLNDPELIHSCSSSVDSVETAESTPSLQLVIHPSYNNNNSSSSSSSDTLNPGFNEEEEELLVKLKSPQVFDIERAVISLRQITRSTESSRVRLCTPRLLLALRPLIMSRYSTIQVNTIAALVNLSLEDINKVKIVRSGMVPLLIDVLKGGFPEAQEHASGALFSLALDDDNKTAIGVLGALEPLMHLLRSENERTQHDSVIALYHLSLIKSNRVRLVKLGLVPVLLGMVKPGHMTGRIMLVLGNMAWCPDGRAAMLGAGAVECLVKFLGGTQLNSESTKESSLSVLYGLSQGGLRFRVLAKAVKTEEVLSKMVKEGSKCVREKAMTILEMMKMTSKEYEEEEMGEEVVNWEDLLELSHTQYQSE